MTFQLQNIEDKKGQLKGCDSIAFSRIDGSYRPFLNHIKTNFARHVLLTILSVLLVVVVNFSYTPFWVEPAWAVTNKSQACDIFQLMKENKIDVKIYGTGFITSIRINIMRNTAEPLRVQIPAGTYFFSAKTDTQNMVSTDNVELELADNGWGYITVPAACANHYKATPKTNNSFSIKNAPVKISQLMKVLSKKKVSTGVKQAAVWITTDRMGFHQFERVGITDYEVILGLKICDEAGIDIFKKDIWVQAGEKDFEYISDENLKQWLKKRTSETRHLYQMNEAKKWLARGNKKAAIESYTRVIEIKPDYPAAYHKRALIYRDLKFSWQEDRWVLIFERSKVFSKQWRKNANGVDPKAIVRNLQKAVTDINSAVKLDSQNIAYFYVRAYSYILLGKFKKAISDYTRIVQLAPDEADAYFYRAIAKAGKKTSMQDNADAEKDLTQAIHLKSDQGHYYSARGKICFDMGKYDQSIQDFRKGISLEYTHGNWDYYYLGLAFEVRKSYAEALLAFQKFTNTFYPVNLNGDHALEDAKIKILKLKSLSRQNGFKNSL